MVFTFDNISDVGAAKWIILRAEIFDRAISTLIVGEACHLFETLRVGGACALCLRQSILIILNLNFTKSKIVCGQCPPYIYRVRVSLVGWVSVKSFTFNRGRYLILAIYQLIELLFRVRDRHGD
jgi:hypothetical protein